MIAIWCSLDATHIYSICKCNNHFQCNDYVSLFIFLRFLNKHTEWISSQFAVDHIEYNNVYCARFKSCVPKIKSYAYFSSFCVFFLFLFGVTACVCIKHLDFIFRWKFSKIKSIWMPMSLYILQCNARAEHSVSTNMIFDSFWMQAHAVQVSTEFSRRNKFENVTFTISIQHFLLRAHIVWPSNVFSLFCYLYANTQ